MEKSRSLAKIIGPTLIVMVFSEMKIWNPTLYETQIIPLIYLNGVLLFVAGLGIIVNHNIWAKNWQTIITVVGYMLVLVGLFRTLFPQIQKSEFKNDTSFFFIELFLIIIGTFLTYKSYFTNKSLK